MVYGVLSGRMLLGDGALFLLSYLQHPGYFQIIEPKRTFTLIMHQAPVLLGQRIGLTSIASFAALYSFAVLVIPAVLMLLSFYLARNQPVIFAIVGAAISVIGFSTTFICTEVNFMAGLAIFSAVLLGMQRPAPILRGFVLPAVAFLLVLSFEGTLLLCPVLVLWSGVMAVRMSDSLERFGLALSTLLFGLGTMNGLWGFLAPRDPVNAGGFVSAIPVFLTGPHSFLLLSAVAVLIGALVKHVKVRLWVASFAIILGLFFISSILNLEGFYAYSIYYYNRAFITLLTAACVVALFSVWWFRSERMGAGQNSSVVSILLIPFVFAVASDFMGTYRWNQYIETFCSVLDRDLSPEARLVELKQAGGLTAWAWTHPTMSALLRDRGSSAYVINEPGVYGWEPFEPTKTPKLDYQGLCQAPMFTKARPDSFELPISFVAGNRFPTYVASITGISVAEGWATWTEGDRMQVHFSRNMPTSFDVLLQVAAAYGANRELPVTVTVGNQNKTFVVGHGAREVRLDFQDIGEANSLSIVIPRASAPADFGDSPDTRRLGLALVSMQIVPR